MPKTVLIVVTHLLGTGHLARALTLARAFAAAGQVPHVISGGFPAPHLDATGVHLHHLPPIRSDGTNFATLLGADDTPITDADRDARQTQLLSLFAQVSPDVVITELFPFGRRGLRAEFTALLETAKAKDTPCFASIRDILAPPSKPRKALFADDMIAQYYKGVLVHSDETAIPFARSWPLSDALAPKLHYTGFVAAALPPAPETGDGQDEILVSAGGGDVGSTLFNAALTAAKRSTDTWRLLVPHGQVAALRAKAPSNVHIDALRPDFRELMQRAKASISFCGYNTAMDVLQTGIPAIFIPFADGGEVEQSLRAEALASQVGIARIAQDMLTPDTLLSTLQTVVKDPPRDPHLFAYDGAERCVEICMKDFSQ